MEVDLESVTAVDLVECSLMQEVVVVVVKPITLIFFCSGIYTPGVFQDGIEPSKPGEIAHLLHMDMAAHRKKTQDFNDGWKVQYMCVVPLATYNAHPNDAS